MSDVRLNEVRLAGVPLGDLSESEQDHKCWRHFGPAGAVNALFSADLPTDAEVHPLFRRGGVMPISLRSIVARVRPQNDLAAPPKHLHVVSHEAEFAIAGVCYSAPSGPESPNDT